MSTPVRIVIPDDVFHLFQGTRAFERLKGLGRVDCYDRKASGPDELIGRLRGAEVALSTRYQTRFGADLLEALPGLRLISIMGTRPRTVDMPKANALGITVTCIPGASSEAIAEHTWMMILTLAKQVPYLTRGMATGHWPRKTGWELAGKTLSLLGLGNIGRKVALMGRGFGMRTLTWSRRMTPERAAEVGAEAATLDRCTREADLLSLHLHVNEGTRGIISRERLAQMKPGSYLVNTARAALVDMEALYEALAGGHLAGAGLDVFEPAEPLPSGSPLRKLPNVILTPHSAWDTDGTQLRYTDRSVENIARFLAGDPINVVTEYEGVPDPA
ncbi:MAG: D-2-hydroxyacid dehydrogenase family protein [Nitrospinota bacterium]